MSARKVLRSFSYAVSGVVHGLRTQRNMRFHFAAAFLVFLVGLYLKVDFRDLLFLFFAVTLVIMAEMFNTAVETVVDIYVKGFHPLARVAKNVAAGAVLVSALNSVVVACIVFFPRLEGAASWNMPYLRGVPLNVTLSALFILVLLAVAAMALGEQFPLLKKKGAPSGYAVLAFGCAATLVLLTGNALVAMISGFLALVAVHGRWSAADYSFSGVITGALLGMLAAAVAFRLAGW